MGGILVFGYGNPGRGDDALGPAFVEAMQRHAAEGVECLTDMQLQVEHVMDLCGRAVLLFVDADAACAAPFHLSCIQAERDVSYTSHAMSPGALLYAYRQVYGRDAPPAYLLRIRGYAFTLGEAMGEQAAANLEAALALAGRLCAQSDPGHWQRCTDALVPEGAMAASVAGD